MEKKFPIEYGTKNICENPNIWEKIFIAIKDIKVFRPLLHNFFHEKDLTYATLKPSMQSIFSRVSRTNEFGKNPSLGLGDESYWFISRRHSLEGISYPKFKRKQS